MPEQNTGSSRLVISQPRKGKVIAYGPKVEGLGKRDSVIFGDDIDKIELTIAGQSQEYYLMDKQNIKLAFDSTEESSDSTVNVGLGRND